MLSFKLTVPFEGRTVSDVIAAVLRTSPDFDALPDETPPSLRRLLDRCLERDPKRRLRDIGDARLEIEEAQAENAAGPDATAMHQSSSSGARRAALLLAGLATGVLATLTVSSSLRVPPGPELAPRPSLRLTLTLPAGYTVTSAPAISHDGTVVAYAAALRVGAPRLFIRRLAESEAREVEGSEGARNPIFSPDGSEVAFYAQNRLWKALVSGGAPSPLADARNGLGATWGEDGSIVYPASFDSGLYRISADGGQPEALTEPTAERGGYAHVYPQFLPGGREILFTIWGDDQETSSVALLSLDTGRWKLVRRVSLERGIYVPSGHLLTIDRSGTARVSPFDPHNPAETGPEVAVVEGVNYTLDLMDLWIAYSDDGTLVYAPGSPRQRKLVWVDPISGVTPLSDELGAYAEPSISPDGTRVVYRDHWEVWVRDLQGRAPIRIVPRGGGPVFSPIWSADSNRVLFASERSRDWEIYSVSAGFADSWTQILTRPGFQQPVSVSPDDVVAFLDNSPGADPGIWTLRPGETPTPLVAPAEITGARFSPDGRLIAYGIYQSSRWEIHVRPYPGPGEPVVVSRECGEDAAWSPDGRQLFYLAGDTVMAVDIDYAGGQVSASSPRSVVEAELVRTWRFDLDVAPDGRFLGVQAEPGSEPTRIEVVTNWFEELEAKAPTG